MAIHCYTMLLIILHCLDLHGIWVVLIATHCGASQPTILLAPGGSAGAKAGKVPTTPMNSPMADDKVGSEIFAKPVLRVRIKFFELRSVKLEENCSSVCFFDSQFRCEAIWLSSRWVDLRRSSCVTRCWSLGPPVVMFSSGRDCVYNPCAR